MVDVEELADLLHREVCFHASVHELLRRPGVWVSAARERSREKVRRSRGGGPQNVFGTIEIPILLIIQYPMGVSL